MHIDANPEHILSAVPFTVVLPPSATESVHHAGVLSGGISHLTTPERLIFHWWCCDSHLTTCRTAEICGYPN